MNNKISNNDKIDSILYNIEEMTQEFKNGNNDIKIHNEIHDNSKNDHNRKISELGILNNNQNENINKYNNIENNNDNINKY
jgi:hypothetical protein